MKAILIQLNMYCNKLYKIILQKCLCLDETGNCTA